VSVVSGGAVGIDRAAHQGALSAGGPTLVVAPAGWERAYPEENQALFQRIVAEGGGYLSLLHPRQPTQRGLFLRRNGCMVALSQAVVLVEAPYRSGARNAAKHARDLGRPLMVVPSSPWVKSGRGSNVELKSGALLVQSSADVLANLKNLGILSKACAPGSSLQLPFEERSSAEERLLRAVHAGAHDVDALSQSTGLSLPEVQAALFALRLTGTLSVDPTGQISLSAP
jgi:DNA processing protein